MERQGIEGGRGGEAGDRGRERWRGGGQRERRKWRQEAIA